MLGICIGLAIAVLALVLGGMAVFYLNWLLWSAFKCTIIEDLPDAFWCIIVALVIAAGMATGCEIEKDLTEKYVQDYMITKQIVEDAMAANIERAGQVQLLEVAMEANKELARKQYNAQRWYGFNIDEDVLELEPIQITGATQLAEVEQ